MGFDEYRRPVTPFGGWVGDGRLGRLVPLETAPHILGLAPPRTGKTRRWLAPSAVLWPGPAVVSSSKDDLMQMVASRRWGKAMLLDLRPITPPFYPRDFVACRYDPTMLIRTLEDAQAAAETLLSMSSVGFGGTQARPATDNGMWETLAFAPLTCLLYAASPAGTGLGIEWALEAAEDVTVPLRWPQQVSTEASWATAALWCGHPLFEARVRGILNMVDKRRDSVKMTATVDGQVLHVDLGRSYVLAAVSITPGWVAKTPGGKDEWSQHRVVSRVQYIFNDTDRTVLTQDTGNAHGPVTTPLPHKLLASRVTVGILQTARPPASPLPAEPALPGFGDSVLGPDGAPLPADSTSTAEPPGLADTTDPVDATFAVSALKLLGHEPN